MKLLCILVLLINSYIGYCQSVPEIHLIFGTVDMTKVAKTDSITFKNTFSVKEDKVLLIQDYNKLYKKVTLEVYYSRLIDGKYKFIDNLSINLNHDSELIEMNYYKPGVYIIKMWNKKLIKEIAFIINNQ